MEDVPVLPTPTCKMARGFRFVSTRVDASSDSVISCPLLPGAGDCFRAGSVIGD